MRDPMQVYGSPGGTFTDYGVTVQEQLARMQSGGADTGMLTSTGGYETPPELPPEDLRGGLYDWFIENASDFPIEDAEWLLETFGVSIDDIPTFIENATPQQLAQLAAYRDAVTSVDNWDELSDWEKDRALLEAGLPDIYGTAGQEPADEEVFTPDPLDPIRPPTPIEAGVPDTLSDEERIEQIENGNWEDFIDSFPTPEEAGQWLEDQFDNIQNILTGVLQTTILPDDYRECEGEGNGGYNSQQECMFNKTRVQVVIPGLPPIPLPGVQIEDIAEAGEGALGSIKDILESAGEAAQGAWDWVVGALEDGTIDVQTVINSVIAGDYTFGGLFEGGVDTGVTAPGSPVTGAPEGAEEEAVPFDRVEQTESLLGDMTAAFGDTTLDAQDPLAGVEDPEKYGFPGAPTTETDVVGDDETIVSGGAEETDSLESLISGFESDDSDLTFGGGTTYDEGVQEPDSPVASTDETLVTGGGSGGGGGGGGGLGKSSDFMARLNYVLPQIAPLIQPSQVDFSPMFTKDPKERKGLQLGKITEGLFGRYF